MAGPGVVPMGSIIRNCRELQSGRAAFHWHPQLLRIPFAFILAGAWF